jgi:hypothetical protein
MGTVGCPGGNFATFIELHDGIAIKGFFSRMFYGDDGWSLIKFYNGFILSLRIVVLLGVTNIIFACISIWKKNYYYTIKRLKNSRRDAVIKPHPVFWCLSTGMIA